MNKLANERINEQANERVWKRVIEWADSSKQVIEAKKKAFNQNELHFLSKKIIKI